MFRHVHHVRPSFRDSLLTRFLQPALGGNAHTTIICTVSPAVDHLTETISTLKFALRAKNIQNAVSVNEVPVERGFELRKQYSVDMENMLRQLKLEVCCNNEFVILIQVDGHNSSKYFA